MATTIDTITEALKQAEEKKLNLRKAFEELESLSSYSLSTFSLTWPDIDSHFSALHSSLIDKLNLLKSHPSDQKPLIESVPLVVDDDDEETVAVKARKDLVTFCESMDGLGLRNYIVFQKPKERPVIGNELRDAFKYAANAPAMVLDALDGFFGPNLKGDKDAQLSNLRKACITMFEGLTESKVEISPEVRERAKSLALDWKEKVRLDGRGIEPYGFLHLVVNYGLVDVFNMDDLIDMSVIATKFAQGVRLFRKLCLGDKMSADFIKKLIGKGKQLQAVKYILEFNLADKFPPIPLLKEYVDEANKNADKTRKDGKNSLQSLNEATAKELNAVSSVVNVIKDFNLETGPFKQTLTKRIEVLEKQKASRKKEKRVPSFGPKFLPQNNLSGTKRPRDTTHSLIPAIIANNPITHQNVVPHVSAMKPVVPLQHSYSSAPSYNTTQSYTHNASSTAHAYQKSYPQLVPGADMATNTSALNVPPYQQSYVQHTPNVDTNGESVSAYRKPYLQPHGSTSMAPYASLSAGGVYGPADIAGYSTHGKAQMYATEPNSASGYNDRSDYSGYVMPAPQYHQTYHSQ